MTPSRTPWPVRIAAAAEADFRDIIRWTAEQFGDTQAAVYGDTITAAFIIFRVSPSEGDEAMEVLRILHDAMDLSRHL